MVFDLRGDPAQIPVIAEPLFRELEAEVEFVPVMTPDELAWCLTMAHPDAG